MTPPPMALVFPSHEAAQRAWRHNKEKTMNKALSQTSVPHFSFLGFDTDVEHPEAFERSILIDDSYDDQTEILTIIRERVSREGLL